MAGTRFLIAGVILFTWRLIIGDPLPNRNEWRGAAIIGLLMITGGVGSVAWVSQWIPSGLTALLIGSIPIWMALIDLVHPGYPTPHWLAILGVLVGFLGIAMLVGPVQLAGEAQVVDITSALIVLFGALLWAIGSISDREAELPDSSLLSTGMVMLAGGIGLLLLGTLAGEWNRLSLEAATQRSMIGLAYQIIFGSLIGFVAYSWLLRVAPTALVSTYAYVTPLIAMVLGNLIDQEPLTLRIILSALMIVGALILISLAREIPQREGVKAAS
jgi:drug/metabolite transporter (DMT)-like permease